MAHEVETRAARTLLFVQVRSIWLPANVVLTFGALVGFLCPTVFAVCVWTVTLLIARRLEEDVVHLSDDIRADRKATPYLILPLPAIAGSILRHATRLVVGILHTLTASTISSQLSDGSTPTTVLRGSPLRESPAEPASQRLD